MYWNEDRRRASNGEHIYWHWPQLSTTTTGPHHGLREFLRESKRETEKAHNTRSFRAVFVFASAMLLLLPLIPHWAYIFIFSSSFFAVVVFVVVANNIYTIYSNGWMRLHFTHAYICQRDGCVQQGNELIGSWLAAIGAYGTVCLIFSFRKNLFFFLGIFTTENVYETWFFHCVSGRWTMDPSTLRAACKTARQTAEFENVHQMLRIALFWEREATTCHSLYDYCVWLAFHTFEKKERHSTKLIIMQIFWSLS